MRFTDERWALEKAAAISVIGLSPSSVTTALLEPMCMQIGVWSA